MAHNHSLRWPRCLHNQLSVGAWTNWELLLPSVMATVAWWMVNGWHWQKPNSKKMPKFHFRLIWIVFSLFVWCQRVCVCVCLCCPIMTHTFPISTVILGSTSYRTSWQHSRIFRQTRTQTQKRLTFIRVYHDYGIHSFVAERFHSRLFSSNKFKLPGNGVVTTSAGGGSDGGEVRIFRI